MDKPEIFATWPAVYAVARKYVITVPVRKSTVMWVSVGGRCFYDDSNGILRSASLTHKMEVPAELLESARSYTVCWREVFDRKPYFAELGDVETFTLPFKPVTGNRINLYHIADAHNRVESPVRAGSWFGDDLDILVLNGDIPNHSGQLEYFNSIHEIAGRITKGGLPVIFSRGNHDTRGIYAENLPDHTPTDCGRSYYTVRLGCVWAIVMDCAEDKADDSDEYGHTICCHDFRLRETEFLRSVAADPEHEYAAPGVKHRLVIVHNPFSETHNPPFDIEQELYAEWCRILRETIRPELMLCGHTHGCYITMPGEKLDKKGAPCPVVCASRVTKDPEFFMGGAFTFEDGSVTVRFTDAEGNEQGTREIPI
jgi:hypothetical protein